MATLKTAVGRYNDAGEVRFTHTEEGLQDLKKQGFRHLKSPVFHAWPKNAYHVSGRARQIGKLEDTDEQNEAAFKALGPEWSLTPPPEAQAQTPGAAPLAPSDDIRKALANEMATINTRLDGIQLAGEQQAAALTDALSRLSAIESLIAEPEPAGGKKK